MKGVFAAMPQQSFIMEQENQKRMYNYGNKVEKRGICIMAMQCAKCSKVFNLLTQYQFDIPSGWCKNCLTVYQTRMKIRFDKFQSAFRHHLVNNGVAVTPQSVEDFYNYARQLEITPEQAFGFVKQDALRLLQRTLVLAKSDNIITPQEESQILYMERAFHLTPVDTASVRAELSHLKVMQSIRSGILPNLRSSLVLPSTETCHWETSANYHKQLTKQTKVYSGQFVVTNQKIRFVSPESGFEYPLSKVVSVRLQSATSFIIQLTRTQGNGLYQMGQAEIICELIHVLLRRVHRQDVVQQAGTRTIPQDVKIGVWQRDGGKCIQCSATDYLEYDHIIPWSKGGATSMNNIQLLCRRCNLAKGDRI